MSKAETAPEPQVSPAGRRPQTQDQVLSKKLQWNGLGALTGGREPGVSLGERGGVGGGREDQRSSKLSNRVHRQRAAAGAGRGRAEPGRRRGATSAAVKVEVVLWRSGAPLRRRSHSGRGRVDPPPSLHRVGIPLS